MQLGFDGKPIDQVAIELIRAYANPDDPYYLGFSGGKDSVVIEHLTRRAGVGYDAHYNVSPIDPPQIHWFIKEHYPDVAWDYHAKGFFGQIFMANGLPRRNQRWCCKYIKEAGGEGRTRILGMRADESRTRSKYKCFQADTRHGGNWLLPIVRWSSNDVWQYIAEHNLPFSALYRHGFNRIGCILCPFHGAAEAKLELQMFPKTAAAWRAASNRYFQKRIERGTPLSQASPDDYWNWWISRK